MADDIAGIDDCIAVTALARRALLRQLVGSNCRRAGGCSRIRADRRRSMRSAR
jgi:hypothetical protein